MPNKLATLSLLVACAAPAFGSEFDTQVLFSHKAWSVEVTHDASDGTLWCNAETTNRNGQSFNVLTFDNGYAAVGIYDSRWKLRKRPISFIIDIDYSRWNIDGTGEDQSVSIGLTDSEKAGDFLQELSDGAAVAVYNADEKRIASFSLAGSSAALLKLMECWEAIQDVSPTQNSDPFQSSKDPFN